MSDVNLTNWIAFAVIYGLLVIASLLILLFRKRLAQKQYLELSDRIRSWWIMAILFTLALTINQVTLIIFFAYISYLALKEYFTIIPTRQVDRRAIFLAYLGIPLQFLWVGIRWYGMFVIFIPVYLFLLIPMRLVTLGQTKGFIKASGTLHWGVMLTVYCVSYVAYLGVLPNAVDAKNQGISYILFLVFLTQFNDVAQYCWGKSLGKKKIIPEVSPNKTTVGFLGGIFTTMVVSFFISPYLTPFSCWLAIIAGLLISVAGFIGDVTMSAVKRDLGIKDTGSLLPGHGGILDRMDSLIFTAPVFFHFLRYLYY